MRNHRLRERRLKLGATQQLIGCLADWAPSGAQSIVSAVERGHIRTPWIIRKIRAAIVYLELEPRRRREWERREAGESDAVEAAILLNRTPIIVGRLVDLLYDGRNEDFDALAARLPEDIVAVAGEQYLEGVTPCVG